MSLLELPSDAEEAVGHLLDRYREDRDRWPLWTYERRDPAFHDIKASWIGQPWVERLMWSGVLPLRDTWRALRIAVRKAGGELIAFDPSKSSVAWLKGGVGPDPEHTPVTARVPVLLRMRHVALFASTADPRPPNKMTDVRLPGRWSVTRLPLDEKDRRDLGSCAVHALSRVKETQGPGGAASLSVAPMSPVRVDGRKARLVRGRTGKKETHSRAGARTGNGTAPRPERRSEGESRC